MSDSRFVKNLPYRLVLPASQIPEGHEVTKPTGTKRYLLRHAGVRVYASDRTFMVLENNAVLQCEDSLNLVARDALLAVHFASREDAAAFLSGHCAEEAPASARPSKRHNECGSTAPVPARTVLDWLNRQGTNVELVLHAGGFGCVRGPNLCAIYFHSIEELRQMVKGNKK